MENQTFNKYRSLTNKKSQTQRLPIEFETKMHRYNSWMALCVVSKEFSGYQALKSPDGEERALWWNNRFKSRQPVDWRLKCPCPYLTRFLWCKWWAIDESPASHDNHQQPSGLQSLRNGDLPWCLCVCVVAWKWNEPPEKTVSNDLYVCVSSHSGRIVRTFYYYYFCLIRASGVQHSGFIIQCSNFSVVLLSCNTVEPNSTHSQHRTVNRFA